MIHTTSLLCGDHQKDTHTV